MTESVDQPFATTCKANGCPLPATVVTNRWDPVNRGQPGAPRWGVCDYHHAAPGEQWTEVTRRIIEHKRCLQVTHAVRNITDQRYKPLPGERIEHWLTRVDRYLKAEILPDDEPSTDVEPGVFDSLHRLLGKSQPASN